MPVNRNAFIRYRILDQCFRNQQRKFDLDELIDTCSDGLYEYAGIRGGVSRRTVQLDIQMMRSDQLGFNAPIEVYERKYYRYSDPTYSITNVPLTETDMDKLYEVVDLLRQFSGFNHFKDLDGMVQRLEDKIVSQRSREYPIIQIDENQQLIGREFLDQIYHAILSKRRMNISYKSFKARQSQTYTFHAFLLKEYRNRWFVLGRSEKDREKNMILALDRIESITVSGERRREFQDLDPEHHFDHVIGVTVSNAPVETVRFRVEQSRAGYVVTKPLHPSQRVVDWKSDGLTFEIDVQVNFELLSELLSFGNDLEVISPPSVRGRLYRKIKQMKAKYE